MTPNVRELRKLLADLPAEPWRANETAAIMLASVTALLSALERAEKVLEPFAQMAGLWHESESDHTMMTDYSDDGRDISLGDCRAAAKLHAELGAILKGEEG